MHPEAGQEDLEGRRRHKEVNVKRVPEKEHIIWGGASTGRKGPGKTTYSAKRLPCNWEELSVILKLTKGWASGAGKTKGGGSLELGMAIQPRLLCEPSQ